MRSFADKLVAGGRRVLLWDRPNCGASDFCFDGESESAMQGRALTRLIRALDLGPTALAGGSAGSRTSLLAAAHDPEIVSHLIQWWISGGVISLMSLGNAYCCDPAVAASLGGMEAVAAMPLFAEQMQRNPRNRDILLAQDPEAFIAVMERWASAFAATSGSPVPGLSADDVARLTMPVMIFKGSSRDIYHPARISEAVHRLIPHSELVDPPWTEEEFQDSWIAATQSGAGHFLQWPRLAEPILAFLAR
jgi:pimeloyl-ACP methyl ester carboxylesterase